MSTATKRDRRFALADRAGERKKMKTLQVIDQARARPFHCGSQAADWTCSNCDRCKKQSPRDAAFDEMTCEIERAIGEAYMSDGTVSQEMAKRMGYDGSPTSYLWQCGEWEPTEAWKIESRRRRTWSYRIRKWWHQTKRAIKDRIENWRNDWRMEVAELGYAEHPDTCWADWVTWAYGYDHDKPEPNGLRFSRCQEEGKTGSCYCGRFRCEAKP